VSGGYVETRDVLERPAVEDSADVVIIGSGAAGATAARVLSEAGLDVAVIEEGPRVPTGALRSDMYGSFRTLWRDMGFQVARGRAITPILQGSCVGGTTAINGAIIHRLPRPIYDAWCAERGVDAFLRYEELERVFDRLDRELAVGPAPDSVLGRHNALFERGVTRLGWHGNRVRRNVQDCDGSAHCNQGCPRARRQSMDNAYIPRAVRHGARIYATCAARELIVRGDRAVGVRGRFRDVRHALRGPELTVHARHAVVLAGSAIQSPLFLLDNRLGPRSRVGRRLQAHPGTAVAGIFDEPVAQWFGATQGYESTQFWDERMKLETVGMPLELAAVRLPGFGARLVERLVDYGHVAFFGVQIRARAHGRVRRDVLGAKVIEYELGPEDVRTLKLGVRRLCELMLAAGARAVLPGVHGLPEQITRMDALAPLEALPDDPRLFHCIAAHLFGTAVMGRSPLEGVVGLDGGLHGLRGFYVADSSVFPSNLGVNPQHSICAFAWLTAENIAERALREKAIPHAARDAAPLRKAASP
jgi:choline dehydrogenase-like flavoprotein